MFRARPAPDRTRTPDKREQRGGASQTWPSTPGPAGPELGNRGAGRGPEAVRAWKRRWDAIAARVREFRLQLGWTVGQLAAQSGLSKAMLSKIENAQASPSLATLARLSKALQVPGTAFFRGLNEEQDVMFVKAGRGLNIEHKGWGPAIATNRSASCARPATPSSRYGSP